MNLSEVIKELQELEREHGGQIKVNAYLFKEWTLVRHIGARVIHTTKGEETEIFIEGDKYQNS